MRHRSAARFLWLAGLGLACSCSSAGTRGPVARADVGREESAGGEEGLPSWQVALLPEENEAEVRAERWGEHLALFFGGRVYGSNGDDVPTEVGAALLPLMLRDEPYQGARWAFVGIGSGVELGVALTTEPAEVDLYERKEALLGMAEELAGESHLVFRGGRPVHEALRIVTSPPEGGPPPTYDFIVHAVGMTVISEPYRLFSVERLQSLGGLLAPGGRVVIHLQIYEIRESTLKTLLRTFAAAFPYGAVVVPEDLTSDMLLVGANEPLAVHLPTVRAMGADPALGTWLEALRIDRATDPAARALMADRAEVMAYAGEGPVYTRAAPMGSTELPRRPPSPPGPGDAASDAWDRACEAWRREQGFDEELVATFYGPEWPFGSPCPDVGSCRFVDGIGSGAAAEEVHGDLALSLLANGRVDAARRLIEASSELHDPCPRTIRAARVYEVLVDHGLPCGPLPLPADARLREELSGVEALLRSEDWEGARDRVSAIADRGGVPASDRPVVDLYRSFAHCAVGEPGGEEALRRFVEDHPDFAEQHPATHCLLSRCLRRQYFFGPAVAAAERYVDLQPAAQPAPPGSI